MTDPDSLGLNLWLGLGGLAWVYVLWIWLLRKDDD